MNYPREYFRNELIDGFEVTYMMKRCWAAQMEVVEQFDQICRKHSVRYFLAYGSLLGAVRHKGFIPWDDDIDVWMMRDDLDKLTRVAREDFAKEGLELVTPFTDEGFEQLVFRLVNTRNYCLREDFLKKYWLFPFMAGLDIFCLDYVPRDAKQLQDQRTLLVSSWLLVDHWKKDDMSKEDKMEVYQQLTDLLGIEQVEEKQIPNQLWKLTDRIGGLYRDEDADMMTIWGYYLHFPEKIFRKEWFSETEYLDFEGLKLPCPIGYKEVLRAEFGEDYMTPKKWTADHSYPYYKDAHSRMLSDFKELGIECPAIYQSV